MLDRTNWGVRYCLLVSSLVVASPAVNAELLLNDSPSVPAISSVLGGPGLQLENMSFVSGIKGQYGLFFGGTDTAGGDPVLSIPDGFYMSTGNQGSILGPNDNTKKTFSTKLQYNDADLTTIADNAVFDPVVAEFTIVPEGDRINFVLVFGSEEYPEYVCSPFNDAFGLFVSGPGIADTKNAAFVPGTDLPIAVNNINAGARGSEGGDADCMLNNSIYFVDNGNGSGKKGSQLDGFSRPITASIADLIPGETYQVKLALADTGDHAFDSAVFFRWLTSTSSIPVDLELTATPSTFKPSFDGFVDVTYTVENTSALATRLVEVGIELPPGVVLVQNDSGEAYDSLTGIWLVDELAGGESRELKLRLSIGDSTSYQIPAEIIFSFNEDPDSTPFNRLTRLNEDDTAIIRLSPVGNNAPMITHANSAATASVSFPESSTGIVVDLDADDVDGETEGNGLTWLIHGGADAEHFSLSSNGLLRPLAAFDFEAPVDMGADNKYEVDVKVCDSHSGCDTQLITVDVTDNTSEDSDGDGVSDDDEKDLGTDPDSADSDGDGVSDQVEVGDDPSNPIDTDGDGIIDALDSDDDGDSIPTLQENYNGGTPADDDTDNDGKKDYLDNDDDNDGLLTLHENYNSGLPLNDDTDGDGKPDYLDADDDNDNLLTINESSDPDGNGSPDDAVDTDGDGKPDYLDRNNAPKITHADSAATAGVSFAENKTGVIVDLNAEDSDGETEGNGLTWLIHGGADSEHFSLSSAGLLRPIEMFDFEAPVDADANNKYQVKVRVCDSTLECDDQLITVNVTNSSEDSDGDGVSDDDEKNLGTDPDSSDSDGDGVSDQDEVGGDPANPLDTDGDGTIDALDEDDDGDSIPTLQENYNGGTPADDDSDNDGIKDYLDNDDDNDGLLTLHENYNGQLPLDDDTDRDGKPDYLDPDDDNDDLLTINENSDPNGDGSPDDAVDTDDDGIVDYLDSDNLNAPNDDNDDDGLSNAEEEALGSDPDNPDTDGDGINDKIERGDGNLPIDSDDDDIPNLLDPDDDNDGVLTVDENYNGGLPLDDDTDGDNKPDYLDPDDDNDGVLTRLEDYNGNGALDEDTDGDMKPDYLDLDDDGDGLFTWHENYNGQTPLDDDTDGDGIADYLDKDDDGDGLLTLHENADPNGNGNPDDGLDSDKDGLNNYRDADDDNDGVLTKDENADPNGDGDPADAKDIDIDDNVDYLDPNFTPFVRVQIRTMLQGAYRKSDGMMYDKLRAEGVLPKTQPYGALETAFGYGSVGNLSPFSYMGTETITDELFAVDGANAAVDWILIEVRDHLDPTKVIASKAGILQRDGDIVTPETGGTDLIISGVQPGSYYLALRHRNHLGVMTAQPVTLWEDLDKIELYDFSDKGFAAYGDNPMEVGDNHQLMISGDLNNSNTVIGNGIGSDMSVLLGSVLVAPQNLDANANYPLKGYYAADLNMDGTVVYGGPENDANLILYNVILHPANSTSSSNFIVRGTVPR